MFPHFVEFTTLLPGGANYRIRMAQGTEYNVELPSTARVSELKARLSSIIGMPAPGLILTFGDEVLKDDVTLEAAHIQEGAALILEFRATTISSLPSVNVAVTLPSGRTINVSLPESNGVEELKRALKTKEPTLELSSLKLTLNQEQLPQNVTVRELAGETLQAITQLPGGR